MEPSTLTSVEQNQVERDCKAFFIPFESISKSQRQAIEDAGLINKDAQVLLLREKHVAYLLKGLETLSRGYSSLDASRPWLVYWILHSLDLLGQLPVTALERCLETLKRCRAPIGAYGGGPQQVPHVAPTYGAVMAMGIIGSETALGSIDRKGIYSFFLERKQRDGSFQVHADGEVDVRASYLVIAVASMLNMLTTELTDGVAEWIGSCQTYEGGLGGEPGNESHGGYTYCGVAALAILDRWDVIDVAALSRWAAARQMKVEGGFQGRTNKLVDGCYSFWVGAIPAILAQKQQVALEVEESERNTSFVEQPAPNLQSNQCDSAESCSERQEAEWSQKDSEDSNTSTSASGGCIALFNSLDLQRYILLCGQQIDGGLRDKPGKNRDFYHTCYCLSGLSIAQHGTSRKLCMFGDSSNMLLETCPVYNIRKDRVETCKRFFRKLDNSHQGLVE